MFEMAKCSNSLDPSSSSCAKPEVLPKIESSHLKHKSLLKATEPPPKKIAPSKKMSAAYQEKIRQEEVIRDDCVLIVGGHQCE